MNGYTTFYHALFSCDTQTEKNPLDGEISNAPLSLPQRAVPRRGSWTSLALLESTMRRGLIWNCLATDAHRLAVVLLVFCLLSCSWSFWAGLGSRQAFIHTCPKSCPRCRPETYLSRWQYTWNWGCVHKVWQFAVASSLVNWKHPNWIPMGQILHVVSKDVIDGVLHGLH